MPLAWLVLIAAGVLDVEHRIARFARGSSFCSRKRVEVLKIAGLGAAGTLRIGVLPFAKA